MSIIFEALLEKRGIGLEVCITENGGQFFTVWEPIAPRSPEIPMVPKCFSSAIEAFHFVNDVHIPSRRSQGWRLKE
jgi:hypothetical protein